ncbi:hypothetical protein MKZ38_001936 [Zalerion maritima]|uniref:Uncharacterized protein n=1 Tax=Zalerion maritima TaxID=339359 RepID=A0AAD5REZ1_9PEZI|nr:hypothetical protein MKZ38_001936 [Zalerion maritima]
MSTQAEGNSDILAEALELHTDLIQELSWSYLGLIDAQMELIEATATNSAKQGRQENAEAEAEAEEEEEEEEEAPGRPEGIRAAAEETIDDFANIADARGSLEMLMVRLAACKDDHGELLRQMAGWDLFSASEFRLFSSFFHLSTMSRRGRERAVKEVGGEWYLRATEEFRTIVRGEALRKAMEESGLGCADGMVLGGGVEGGGKGEEMETERGEGEAKDLAETKKIWEYELKLLEDRIHLSQKLQEELQEVYGID